MKQKLLVTVGLILILAGSVIGAATLHRAHVAGAAEAGACGCGCGSSSATGAATASQDAATSSSSSARATPATVAAGTLVGDPLKSCGVLSLYQVCRARGVKTSPAELVKLSHAGAKGVTMLGLAEAAQVEGLKTTGMRISYADLIEASKPLVAWFHEGHFVAVREAAPQGVKLYDNAKGEITLSRAELEKRWSGEVLVIGSR